MKDKSLFRQLHSIITGKMEYLVTIMSTKKKKVKRKIPKGYDSGLEYDLHNNELKDWEYHPSERIEYVTPSTYEADFRRETSDKIFLVEVKGRFRTRNEASKYIHIRESLQQGKSEKETEIIFVFQDADKPMPFVRKRKDGTKQTHGEWAEKNGFRYECVKIGIPERWVL